MTTQSAAVAAAFAGVLPLDGDDEAALSAALATPLATLGLNPDDADAISQLVATMKRRMLFGPESTLPAAATVNLTSAEAALIQITGASTTISSFGPVPDQTAGGSPVRIIRFENAQTVAALGEEIAFAAGDAALVIGLTGTEWALLFKSAAAATVDAVPQIVEGREYLGAFVKALTDYESPVEVLISGDSTTASFPNVEAPRYTPQTLLANQTRAFGLDGIYYTARGYSAKTTADWLATYLADDIASAPKLFIFHFGLNDHKWGITPEETRANMQTGLAAMRAEFSREEMAIVVMSPNMSNYASSGRSPEWFAEILPIMREVAAEYECCFIDVYTPFKNADGTLMLTESVGEDTGIHLHPTNGMQTLIWGLVADTIIPKALRRSRNRVVPDVIKARQVTSNAWLSSDGGSTTSFRYVCWASDFGRFVAVGASGTGQRVVTSDDGITWTPRTSAADDNWQEVCYSPDLKRLVAVAGNGAGGRVMTSDDGGITWTARVSAGSSGQWLGVAWSPERRLFAACGLNTALMWSPDGITWTTQAPAITISGQTLRWSRYHGVFIMPCSTGQIMISYDGAAWYETTVATGHQWYGVAVDDESGLLVAVANDTGGNNVATSRDGINWTVQTGFTVGSFSIAYYPEIGLFVAVTNSGTGGRVRYSKDGVTWTAGTSAADNAWQSVCVAPELGLLCAVASDGSGNNVMTSVSAHSYPYRS